MGPCAPLEMSVRLPCPRFVCKRFRVSRRRCVNFVWFQRGTHGPIDPQATQATQWQDREWSSHGSWDKEWSAHWQDKDHWQDTTQWHDKEWSSHGWDKEWSAHGGWAQVVTWEWR